MGRHRRVALTDEQRQQLMHLIRAGNTSDRLQTRTNILLLSDRSQGQARSDQAVADACFCSPGTVRAIRRRFAEGGLAAALHDKGWPGAEEEPPPDSPAIRIDARATAHITSVVANQPVGLPATPIAVGTC